jgi:hypothetical protein
LLEGFLGLIVHDAPLALLPAAAKQGKGHAKPVKNAA